jgi:EAL domain-containing protein (putative c-di-GMP-specific phosphodiesterase class I)
MPQKECRSRVEVFKTHANLRETFRLDPSLKRHCIVERDVFSEIAAHAGAGAPALVYQPQVSYPIGGVIGLEVLFRWRAEDAPKRHSPLMFLPQLTPAQTSELFFWVMEEAISEARVLSNWTGWNGYISVNIEADQIGDPALIEHINTTLQRYAWAPERLMVEVTERRAIPAFPSVARNVQSLRKAGVRVAMDDFGEGYASFEYLKILDPSDIKIPASFTADVTKDVRNAEIVRALVEFSRRLSINVVAEGVETRECAHALHTMGLQSMQGYLFGEPRELEEWAQLLKQPGASVLQP